MRQREERYKSAFSGEEDKVVESDSVYVDYVGDRHCRTYVAMTSLIYLSGATLFAWVCHLVSNDRR